jgi:hypothetical protein
MDPDYIEWMLTRVVRLRGKHRGLMGAAFCPTVFVVRLRRVCVPYTRELTHAPTLAAADDRL